jgi:hypothetical protein
LDDRFSPRNRSFASEDGQLAVFSTMSAAFSPIMIDGALVLPDVSVGMIEVHRRVVLEGAISAQIKAAKGLGR